MSQQMPVPELKHVLHTRAIALARTPELESSMEGSLDLLELRLSKEQYAIETRFVHEVSPLKSLTLLPSSPAFIAGIVNSRGRILPVLNLKTFLGIRDDGLSDLHRVIFVSGHGLELGLLADVSVGVRRVPAGLLQAGLPTLTGIGADYVAGVTADGLIVLNMDRILTDPRIIVNEEVEP